MHALSVCLFALAPFLIALASPVPTDPSQLDHPPWDQVYLKSVNYAGSGCPAGSVSPTISPDGSFINVAFDQYIASVGPKIGITENRKNCQLTFELHYPPGWSVTLFDTTYYGFVKLDDQVTASQISTYRWGGDSTTADFSCGWVGKVNQLYTCHSELKEAAFVWSSCKGISSTLVINTSVQADNSDNTSGSGLITADAIEERVIQKYGCRWHKC